MIFIVISNSCSPQEDVLAMLTPNKGNELVKQLNPKATPDPNDSNTIIFNMDEVPGIVGVWRINGTVYPKNIVKHYYDWKGSYKVEAFAYNKNGTCSPDTISFEVTKTNPEVCAILDYVNLTGGCNAANGKTWVLDSQNKGYYGLGAITSSEPDWWAADPGSHNGVYDDEITFVLNQNMKYLHETHGSSGLDSQEVPWAAYTTSWYITTDPDSGFKYLQLSGEGFIPPRSSDSVGKHAYKIISLTADKMILAMVLDTQAWFYTFIPKTN